MDRNDGCADRSREVACTLLRLARPLIERSGDRIAAAEISLLIGRMEAQPQARTGRREDMWKIVIPRPDARRS